MKKKPTKFAVSVYTVDMIESAVATEEAVAFGLTGPELVVGGILAVTAYYVGKNVLKKITE